jgi:nucleotide-binding universal stress UspA family protein
MTAAAPRAVLAPVDFGEASARAVAIAGRVAHTCEARLRLLHAESSEAPAYFTHEQVEVLERERQATRLQAEQFLSEFGRRHTTTPFSGVVDNRPPVEAILMEAKNCDLVVMGTHGRRGPTRWWLGSVAERVLRSAAWPLLVVRGVGRPPEATFEHVLVHAAAPLSGATALAYAAMLAGRFHGTVTDARHAPVEAALERADGTLLVAAAPNPRAAAWLADYGERLVRFCTVPILFVPEPGKGGSS